MEIEKIEAEIEKRLDAHFVKSKQYCVDVMNIIWNVSFIMRKYPNDENIKHFTKNIVLSIHYNWDVDEVWKNVNRLYKELNAYIESKYELK